VQEKARKSERERERESKRQKKREQTPVSSSFYEGTSPMDLGHQPYDLI
jgi:hypothetical protein